MARNGLRPFCAAKLAIRTPASAITMPLDRSIPVVMMTRVCPMASTPTTITCCRISEKLGPERNRGLITAKKMLAISSAATGPRIGDPSSSLRKFGRTGATLCTELIDGTFLGSGGGSTRLPPPKGDYYLLPQQLAVPKVESLLSTPSCALSVISVTPVSV